MNALFVHHPRGSGHSAQESANGLMACVESIQQSQQARPMFVLLNSEILAEILWEDRNAASMSARVIQTELGNKDVHTSVSFCCQLGGGRAAVESWLEEMGAELINPDAVGLTSLYHLSIYKLDWVFKR